MTGPRDALADTKEEVAMHLDEIKFCWKDRNKVKLTLLVRHPDYPEQDFMMTDDDPDEAIKMIERRKAAGPDQPKT